MTNTEQLKWHIKEIPLGELKEFEHNPRRINKKALERLVEDIKNVGYHNRIIVDDDNVIIGGHARKAALLKAGYKKTDRVECLHPSRPLRPEEFKQVNIQDNLSYGEFDFDMLANHFEVEELIDWGMPEEWLMEPEVDAKMPELLDSEKLLSQVTIYLDDEQLALLDKAIDKAKDIYKDAINTPNNQSLKGCVVSKICELFLNGNI